MVSPNDLNRDSFEGPASGTEQKVLPFAEAASVLEALSSETSRRIMLELSKKPATPSAVADRADTSVQNALYHLKKLHASRLITIAGTYYSEKGREMDVYAPVTDSVVINLGDSEITSSYDPGTRERTPPNRESDGKAEPPSPSPQ